LRIVVNPASSVRFAYTVDRTASSSGVSVAALTIALPVPSPVMCVWQSISPGRTVDERRSMTFAPGGVCQPSCTATMRSPAMRMLARSRGAVPAPSISRPA
jgi:hypothetical protein